MSSDGGVVFSDNEKNDLNLAFATGGVVAVATKAIELCAARSGTMTAEEVATGLKLLGELRMPTFWRCDWVAEMAAHIFAQGSRMAVLEKERDEWRTKAMDANTHPVVVTIREERDEARGALDSFAQKARQSEEAAASWAKMYLEVLRERDSVKLDLEATRKFLSELEEALCPTVLIAYAMNHPKHTRGDANALKWSWETLDKVATLFATAPLRPNQQAVSTQPSEALCENCDRGNDAARCTCTDRIPRPTVLTYESVEQAVRAWWAEAMGNLPGPALNTLLERLRRVVPSNSEKLEQAEDLSDSVTRDALMGDGYEKGVEAMRAACWEAVQAAFVEAGWSDEKSRLSIIRAAIEGAVP